PLLDRDGWDVVGAVAADPPGEGWLLSPWSLAALLLLCVAGTQAVRALGAPRDPWRQALARYRAAAGLFGVAVFGDVRLAGHGALARRPARAGGARPTRSAARRLESRGIARAAARDRRSLGIPGAVGVAPRRVHRRTGVVRAVSVRAPLQSRRAGPTAHRA